MSDGSEEAVHRLLDMVVEEVSLVDRPANQRRFLVVKRDQMEKKTQKADAPAEEEAASGGSMGTDYSMDDSPLGIAAAALEGLTAIVEMLSAGEAGTEDARLGELAQELRALCEQLVSELGQADAGAEGNDNGEEPPDDKTAAKAESAAAGKANSDPAAKASDPAAAETDRGVRAKHVLTRLSELVGKLGQLKKVGVTPNPEPPKQEPAPTLNLTALETTVSKLAESMQALTDAMKESGQRLSRVEKQFGLPNSTPAAERKPTPLAADVGWPLDLNRPMDRESVDKAVSFHDL